MMRGAAFWLSASALAVVSAASAAAQTSGEMEDIIVTAQKRAESLQDVPIAISVVTAGSLTNAGIRSTQDLSQSVAGLNVTRTTEATVFTLRGVGTQGGSTGQDSAVATFIDGVYIPSMAGSTFALNNIERIEVLKGPQGTLYGRNATGGAVNVVTRTPKQDLAIEASAGVANLATMEGSFYITGGTGAVAADVAVYYRNQGRGFGENRIINRDINKSRDFIIRSKLLFELGDETRMVFSGDYGRTQGSIAMAYRPVPTSQLVDGTGYAEFIAGGNGYYDSQSEFNSIMDTRMFGGSFRFEHGFGDFMLTNILAFRGADGFQRVEVDATPVKIVDAPLFNSEKQWTEELQLSYGSGPLTAIVGFFYMDATSRYDPFQIAGLAITGQTGGLSNRIINYSAQKTRSYAGFGQATWSVSDNTNLTAGFRYTVDKRTLEAEQSLAIGMPLPDAMCRSFCYPDGTLFPLASFDQSRTFKKPTWRLAVDHQLTPELMLYGSYSRGFKSGVFNLTSPGDPPAQPETLDAFELGFKSTLLDRIRFNAAAFYYDYKNIQAFQVNGATTTLTNAATARIYGFDFDFLAELGAGFSLAGSGAYLHHRYGDFPVATITFLEKPPGAPDYPGYTPGLGNYVFPNCSDSAHTGNFYCSASGNRLVNTPDFSMNLTLNHEMDLGSGRLNSNVNWSYSSSFYWAVDNREKQDSFSLFNAQLAWTAPGDQFSVRLWGRNLGNKKYLVTLNQNGTGDIGSPAPGRTYGVTLGFTY